MKHPKVFVSYSWSSPDHEKRVIDLATTLVDNGVDIIIDRWNLKEGDDTNVFMEKMVSDPEIQKVIMVCDKIYCEKTNKRQGGVGSEAQIISNEIYEKNNQNKFVAVVVEKDMDGKPYLPIYYKSRIYIDLSNDIYHPQNFEQLLRWIYDKPLYKKPELGTMPLFLDNEKVISLKTTFIYKRLIESIRNNNSNKYGSLKEYLNCFSENLESFRIKKSNEKEIDELIVESIELFLPYRNEFIEIIKLLSIYEIDSTIIKHITSFFESLISYLTNTPNMQQWHAFDFDNFKFIIHELFLFCCAILIKEEYFLEVSKLLSIKYYCSDYQNYDQSRILHFSIFKNYLYSIKHRNERLKLNKLSLHADLLKKRSQSSGIDFTFLMQADFLLYIRGLFDVIRFGQSAFWFPDTMLYFTYPKVFEVFAKSKSEEYFNKLKVIFDIESKEEINKILQLLKEKKHFIPKWQFEGLNISYIMNYNNLCKYK